LANKENLSWGNRNLNPKPTQVGKIFDLLQGSQPTDRNQIGVRRNEETKLKPHNRHCGMGKKTLESDIMGQHSKLRRVEFQAGKTVNTDLDLNITDKCKRHPEGSEDQKSREREGLYCWGRKKRKFHRRWEA